ncbi:MAG TPA: periplasmic heavy metal sensor [Candidatus Udaeobacter sp.]|nr:periplasmic heavy metal sensor [Candidatus Udaeobacter sp.]
MKHWLRVFLFVLLISFVAAGACYLALTGRFFERQRSAGAVDYHYWIHGRLGLDTQQEKALEPIEARFAGRKRELMAQIREGNRELADAIAADQSDSAKVQTAVDKIHRAQGELQKAVLEHVFEMRPVLRADQYERLIKLTADALRDAPELQ